MKSSLEKIQPLYLVGPTCVGKTAVALELAKILPIEIIAADSMQVYQGVNIGTAKPTAEEQKKVKHHLIDAVKPSETFDVCQFVNLASSAIEKIQRLKKIPLIAGGTGFYIKALIDGLFEGPSKDESVRRRLEEEGKNAGWDVLYKRLQKVDAAAAAAIPSGNHRRVVRALEVYELTGRPISSFQSQWDNPRQDVVILGLERDRTNLRERIGQRVDQMFDEGLVEEARQLLAQDIEKNATVMQAIGYKEIFSYLREEISLEAARGLIKTNTRRFAKRQMTWFKKDKRIRWFLCEENEKASAIAKRLSVSLQN
jgi:tRNA dimethylallyltransferase